MDKKELKALRAKREEHVNAMAAIVDRAVNESRDFSAEENQERGRLTGLIESTDDQIRAGEKQLKDERKAAKAAEARNTFGYGTLPGNDPGGSVTVKSSQRTYYKGGPFNYMSDLVASINPLHRSAIDRLTRHSQEMAVDAEAAQQRIASGSPKMWDQYFVRQMRAGMAEGGMSPFEAQYRALSTAAGSGGEFVPPMYLTAEYVPYARAARVFADACHKEELPPGTMSLNIPKISGGTTVNTQGTQNTNVSDTDLQTEYVTFPVVTVAGQQILSLQLLERSPIAFDDVTFADLHAAMAAQVDFKCIAGPGSGDVTGALNTSGINTIAFPTVTSPATFQGVLYGAIAQAKAEIAATRFLPATHVFMTPGRWETIEQLLDANGRPLVVPASAGPWNPAQVAPASAVAQGETGGVLLGLNAVQDQNVPAASPNDSMIVAKMDDLWLYESAVIARALPQTYGNQLSVLLQVYEYMAFTAARYPNAISDITGAGLVYPYTYNN